MGRPRLTSPDIDEFPDASPSINGEFTNDTELQNDIDTQISSVTSEFSADDRDVTLKIKFHRVLPQKGRRAWLFDILPSELPVMDRIRDHYGDGTYEASVYKNGNLYRKFQFDIERPKFPAQAVKETGSSEISTVLAAIAEQNERQFQQLKELMLTKQSVSVPVSDPVNMMSAMLGAMVQMKNLMAPAPQPGSMGSMELFIKGIEVAKEMNSGDRETNLLDVLNNIIKSPIVEKAIESYSVVPQLPRAQAQEKLPSPVSIVKPSQDKQPITSPEKGDQTVKVPDAFIKQYVNMLVERAMRGSDPDLYADFVLDNVPENIIREHLANETIIEDLSKLDPRVLQHKEWFVSLRDSLLNALTDDSSDDDTNEDATVIPTPGNPDGAPEGEGGST
jgi:hypothetical protein